MKDIEKIISIVILGLLTIGLVFVQSEKWLKNNAVDGCSHNSKYVYENIENGVRTEEAIEDNFEECMEMKGY